MLSISSTRSKIWSLSSFADTVRLTLLEVFELKINITGSQSVPLLKLRGKASDFKSVKLLTTFVKAAIANFSVFVAKGGACGLISPVAKA